jgi:hypothetical protein
MPFSRPSATLAMRDLPDKKTHTALQFACMALVRPTDQERARQASRKLSLAPADSPVRAELPNHPTLLEIADRQKQIESWEAFNVGGYRFAKLGTVVGTLGCAVMVFLAVTPIPPNWPWDIPLIILAPFAAVGTVICGLLWFEKPHIGPRPETLEIVPFSRQENLHLMGGQAVEPFQVICNCPGCGDKSTHLIRDPAEGEPGWATVVRRCGVCKREWAQA